MWQERLSTTNVIACVHVCSRHRDVASFVRIIAVKNNFRCKSQKLFVVSFYKTNCGIMRLSKSVLPRPKISRTTRSADANSQNFQTRKCKTSTYQQSYTIRTPRIWDVLPRSITNEFNSLTLFKKLFLQYYRTALEMNYITLMILDLGRQFVLNVIRPGT